MIPKFVGCFCSEHILWKFSFRDKSQLYNTKKAYYFFHIHIIYQNIFFLFFTTWGEKVRETCAYQHGVHLWRDFSFDLKWDAITRYTYVSSTACQAIKHLLPEEDCHSRRRLLWVKLYYIFIIVHYYSVLKIMGDLLLYTLDASSPSIEGIETTILLVP